MLSLHTPETSTLAVPFKGWENTLAALTAAQALLSGMDPFIGVSSASEAQSRTRRHPRCPGQDLKRTRDQFVVVRGRLAKAGGRAPSTP